MSGTMDRLKGKAKKAQGHMTGSRMRKIEGTLDELKGKAKDKIEGFEREVEHNVRKRQREEE